MPVSFGVKKFVLYAMAWLEVDIRAAPGVTASLAAARDAQLPCHAHRVLSNLASSILIMYVMFTAPVTCTVAAEAGAIRHGQPCC